MRARFFIAAALVVMLASGCSGGGDSAGAQSSPPAPGAGLAVGALPCNDAQFTSDQSRFANGSIHTDQFEDICGTVTRVLAERTTASGTHGYFYIALPSGYHVEIVANLDAMANAPTDKPPATWPWIAVGQYAYVQGRYYYDSARRQGVDWTEDDTSRAWPHPGYVAVCDATRAACAKYW